MSQQVITEEEAMHYIDEIGPHLGGGGFDITYRPYFPDDRKNVCVVVRNVSNRESTYGFYTVWGLWDHPECGLHHGFIVDSRGTKDTLLIDGVRVEGNDFVVEVRCTGSHSGKPWKRTLRVLMVPYKNNPRIFWGLPMEEKEPMRYGRYERPEDKIG